MKKAKIKQTRNRIGPDEIACVSHLSESSFLSGMFTGGS